MSCFSCVPPPASLKPRKIYNVLVPDVFPLSTPADSAPVAPSTLKKIGKLHEYICKNPHKIPKARCSALIVHRSSSSIRRCPGGSLAASERPWASGSSAT